MKRILGVAAMATAMLVWAGVAFACHLDGHVFCDQNKEPMAGVTIHVASTDGKGFEGSAVTDDQGYYYIELPVGVACYRATAFVGANEYVVDPAGGVYDFCFDKEIDERTRDWFVWSPKCEQKCWLTAGGAKFDPITGTKMGENGPKHSWGGNVNPGCSPTAGEGGQWNHIAHSLKLHFQGWAIEVVRCGNVRDIPPGSDSPDTPYNFIEFRGTGTLKGIKGNKVDYGDVYFWAHCEDRNEPGSKGERDGAYKDRYFLHVFSDPGDPIGSTLLLIDEDGNPETMDPVTITDGNMQIHISGCDFVPPPLEGMASGAAVFSASPTVAVTELSFVVAGPNPTRDGAMLRYALPKASPVSLRVYDVTGRLVRDLASGERSAGLHSVAWDLRDVNGMRVARGVYFARLTTPEGTITRTLSVVR